MEAGDIAAVVAAAAAAILAIGLLYALAGLSRSLRELQNAVDELHRETIPLVRGMQEAVDQAHADLDRFDGLIATAESVGHTVDAASRLAYLTFSNPIVKVMAFGAGVARAGRRLRRTEG